MATDHYYVQNGCIVPIVGMLSDVRHDLQLLLYSEWSQCIRLDYVVSIVKVYDFDV